MIQISSAKWQGFAMIIGQILLGFSFIGETKIGPAYTAIVYFLMIAMSVCAFKMIRSE